MTRGLEFRRVLFRSAALAVGAEVEEQTLVALGVFRAAQLLRVREHQHVQRINALGRRELREHFPGLGVARDQPYEPQPPRHAQDAVVDGEDRHPEREQQRVPRRLRADAVEAEQVFLGRGDVHVGEEVDAELPVLVLQPPEQCLQPPGAHPREAADRDVPLNLTDRSGEDFVPRGERPAELPVSREGVRQVRVLRKHRLDEHVEPRARVLPHLAAVHALQQPIDPAYPRRPLRQAQHRRILGRLAGCFRSIQMRRAGCYNPVIWHRDPPPSVRSSTSSSRSASASSCARMTTNGRRRAASCSPTVTRSPSSPAGSSRSARRSRTTRTRRSASTTRSCSTRARRFRWSWSTTTGCSSSTSTACWRSSAGRTRRRKNQRQATRRKREPASRRCRIIVTLPPWGRGTEAHQDSWLFLCQRKSPSSVIAVRTAAFCGWPFRRRTARSRCWRRTIRRSWIASWPTASTCCC